MAKIEICCLLALLVLGSFLLESTIGQEVSCREIKKQGYKADCPAWTDKNHEWTVLKDCADLSEGTCGRGTKTESRARVCTYLHEAKGKRLNCIDSQDRLENCKLQCGPNGEYNEALDVCECKEDYEGVCCEIEIEACTNPILKKGETDRSIIRIGGTRCDARLKPGWYIFDSPAGNLMPTECVPYGRCNTAVPFWLNGTHPKMIDGVVDRVACGTQDGDCCKHKLNIRVRNCGKHMAYYLVPTEMCNQAYCIGNQEKCPPGESSESGFHPDCTIDFVCDNRPNQVTIHRDTRDCSKYYICEGDITHHMPCPVGLLFSESKMTCYFPQEVPECF